MLNLSELEKKINSELTTKINNSEIKHHQLYIDINKDDLNINFGKSRLKASGSDGGHNGLKDIANSLNTSNFSRLRFGIGNNFKNKYQVDFVLSKWNNEESNNLGQLINKNVEIIFSTIKKGTEFAMNKYN